MASKNKERKRHQKNQDAKPPKTPGGVHDKKTVPGMHVHAGISPNSKHKVSRFQKPLGNSVETKKRGGKKRAK